MDRIEIKLDGDTENVVKEKERLFFKYGTELLNKNVVVLVTEKEIKNLNGFINKHTFNACCGFPVEIIEEDVK